MSEQSKQLADRLKAFNDELIRLIQPLDPDTWRKRCASETWSIGVVARHLGAGHYRAVDLAKLIIAGQPVPEFPHDAIHQMNAAHAKKNADCTKEQVLAILEKHGGALVDYVAGLSDEALDRSAHVPAFGAKMSARQILEEMIITSGNEHLESIRRTISS